MMECKARSDSFLAAVMVGWIVFNPVSASFALPVLSKPYLRPQVTAAGIGPTKVLDHVFLGLDPTVGDESKQGLVEEPHLSQGYRDPKSALVFLDRFDEQLGISPEMKAEKREGMRESAHAFFRATPALFYHDLHGSFSESSRLLPDPAPQVAIVGDAHVLNVGTFRGPDGYAVWGLNDFDQAALGSPEWDLERMGVSLYVAGRSGGLSAGDALGLVREMGESYLKHLDEDAPAYLTEHEASGRVGELIEKANSKHQGKFLKKWTTDDGQALHRGEDLVDVGPTRAKEFASVLEEKFPSLTLLDVASKPHSGGSTRGLERYYALVCEETRHHPFILEMKEVLPSPVKIQDGDLSRGDGQEVLDYQRQMGSPVDERHRAFKLDGKAFFTREREREKGSLKDNPIDLKAASGFLGQVLARAHSRSGEDLQAWVGGRDELFLARLEAFSQTYARQVESDYRALCGQGSLKRPSTPVNSSGSETLGGFFLLT